MTTVPARGKLMWFALAVTMLTGFVDATGFLAFGRLFLASPDAGSIVAGVALVADLRFGLLDRKSVVSGQSVSGRVDPGGRRIIKKKKENKRINIHDTEIKS